MLSFVIHNPYFVKPESTVADGHQTQGSGFMPFAFFSLYFSAKSPILDFIHIQIIKVLIQTKELKKYTFNGNLIV